MRSQDSVPSELNPLPQNPTLAVIGLGLPLAGEFGKKFRTTGSDLSQHNIDALGGHGISLCPRARKVLRPRRLCWALRSRKTAPIYEAPGWQTLVANFQGFGLNVVVHDPVADAAEAAREYGVRFTVWKDLDRQTDAMLLAVSHRQYLQTPIADILAHLKPGRVFTDIKSAFDPEAIRQAGFIPSRP